MDTLGNMLIMIKNAGNAGKESVSAPYSHFKYAVAAELLRLGYISSLNKRTKKGFKVIEMGMAYEGEKSKIKGVERVSKLSKRIYIGARDIRPVRQGYGNLIISTPKGILTGKNAVKEKVGGEVLFKIW